MGCNCGNSIGSLTCGGSQPCDPDVVDGCNPLTNCRCGTNPCQCGQRGFATPTPYYATSKAVQENHNTTIIQQVFVAALSNDNSFNIPACNNTAVITIAGLVKIQIGSYLWNANYGYLKVVSFDYLTSQVTVMNDCSLGSATVGVTVPPCTMFNLTDPPCNCPGALPSGPYLAVDFTAPAVGDCLAITVTSTVGIQNGTVVSIGTGTYVVNSIVSSTSIRICNTGAGVIPGAIVYAKDIFGSFITPILVLAS